MTKKVQNLIGKIIADLTTSNVKVVLKGVKKVRSGKMFYNGWFNTFPLEFVVAIGKSANEWLPVMLHEYCHFCQWQDNAPCWTAVDKYEAKYPMDWDNWIKKKKNYPIRRINKWVRLSQEIELDCEKRTVALINKENIGKTELGMDVKDYIMRANTYIYFYSILPKLRTWYKNVAPYEVPEIAHMMPPFFLDDYRKVPPRFKKLVIENCINN